MRPRRAFIAVLTLLLAIAGCRILGGDGYYLDEEGIPPESEWGPQAGMTAVSGADLAGARINVALFATNPLRAVGEFLVRNGAAFGMGDTSQLQSVQVQSTNAENGTARIFVLRQFHGIRVSGSQARFTFNLETGVVSGGEWNWRDIPADFEVEPAISSEEAGRIAIEAGPCDPAIVEAVVRGLWIRFPRSEDGERVSPVPLLEWWVSVEMKPFEKIDPYALAKQDCRECIWAECLAREVWLGARSGRVILNRNAVVN